LPGANVVEMERSQTTSFCCGAGGARMWMEETIGSRINEERAKQALATGAATIAVACPFCNVMLSDAMTSKDVGAPEGTRVAEFSTLLLESVKKA
jgi:Fe-S oxidoreductase